MSMDNLKRQAKRFQKLWPTLSHESPSLSLSQCKEIMAQLHGYESFYDFSNASSKKDASESSRDSFDLGESDNWALCEPVFGKTQYRQTIEVSMPSFEDEPDLVLNVEVFVLGQTSNKKLIPAYFVTPKVDFHRGELFLKNELTRKVAAERIRSNLQFRGHNDLGFNAALFIYSFQSKDKDGGLSFHQRCWLDGRLADKDFWVDFFAERSELAGGTRFPGQAKRLHELGVEKKFGFFERAVFREAYFSLLEGRKNPPKRAPYYLRYSFGTVKEIQDTMLNRVLGDLGIAVISPNRGFFEAFRSRSAGLVRSKLEVEGELVHDQSRDGLFLLDMGLHNEEVNREVLRIVSNYSSKEHEDSAESLVSQMLSSKSYLKSAT